MDFPINQSCAITDHVIKRFPGLAPPAYKEEIMKLLYKMHELNFFTLSFVKSPKLASGFVDNVDRILARSDISDKYRKLLEYKKEM
jgi:hypothetical protein